MEIGEKLGQTALVIDSIKAVAPVKWNGIDGGYEICQPREKQGDMIVTNDGGLYFIPNEAVNREFLLDIT